MPLPHGLAPDDSWTYDGPLDFIANYVEVCRLLRLPEDFRRIAVELCEDLRDNGVRYAEAVFSPSNHAPRLEGDWYGPIEAVLDGLDAGRRSTGVQVELCPDIVRDLGPEEAERTLEVALKFAGRGVIALNAAGSERTIVGDFAHLFRRAKDAGLRSVPHAGEWAGPENVWATLEHYAPDRIGHGVAAAKDPRLMETLAERAIPLEISPVSNVATGVYASLAAHPFMDLRAAGVIVTLNSDDPPMFGAWLGDVFAQARQAWGLTDEGMADIARTGVEASFAPDHIKADVSREIDAWLNS
jgi:adenosine deaminase